MAKKAPEPVQYTVKSLYVGGINNKVFKSGDTVTALHFPEGNAETLVEKGFLILKNSESKKPGADKNIPSHTEGSPQTIQQRNNQKALDKERAAIADAESKEKADKQKKADEDQEKAAVKQSDQDTSEQENKAAIDAGTSTDPEALSESASKTETGKVFTPKNGEPRMIRVLTDINKKELVWDLNNMKVEFDKSAKKDVLFDKWMAL